jgi:hypothetical protein
MFCQADEEENREKPKVISLLRKKLYAAPVEGEELIKLKKDLEEASKHFNKGRKTEAEIKELAEASELDRATIGYGLACWHLYNDDKDRARDYYEKIVDNNKYWPAFGFISAEAELARMKK